MSDPLSGLLAALDLTDTGARTSEDIFTGQSQWMPLGRVFGGQVLAQSLVAAQRTISEERFVHSMHAYFLRPGNVELPITFSVDRIIHDGRSFSTRRVQAYQEGQPILSMISSFQDVDAGVEHQAGMPDDLYPIDHVHSDNGSEFLNDPVTKWADDHNIVMTRSRPSHSNDNPFAEQKNGAIVRRSAFNYRYDTDAELALLNELWHDGRDRP